MKIFRMLKMTAISLVVISQAISALAAPLPTGSRLRDLADARGFLIGGAVTDDSWLYESDYKQTLEREFNIITPENEMKFATIHPSRYVYNWSVSDPYVQLAQANNMTVHGHTLIWHKQVPDWVLNGGFSSNELVTVMNEHIITVMANYLGEIPIWDVVNEAITGSAPYELRSSIWLDIIGPNYIDLAFQFARAADPDCILIYNDYGIYSGGAKADAVYDLLAGMIDRNVPIDAVGFQMHLGDTVDIPGFIANMQRFADLGMDIYITEFDSHLPVPSTQAELDQQGEIYRQAMEAALNQPACKGFQTWGMTDKYSWIPDFWTGRGNALPFDTNYNAKVAYYGLQSELAQPVPETLVEYNMQTSGSRTVASFVVASITATDLTGNELDSPPGDQQNPVGDYYTTWSPDTGGGSTAADALAVNSYVTLTVTPEPGKWLTLDSLSFKVFAATTGPSTRQLYVFSDKTGYVNGGELLTASTTSGTPRIPYNTSPGQTFTIDLSGGNAFVDITDSVTFRVYIQMPYAGQNLAFDDVTIKGTVKDPSAAILLVDYDMQTSGSRTVASFVDASVSATDLTGNELNSLPGHLENPAGDFYTTWTSDTGGGSTAADALAVNSYVTYTVTPVPGKSITLDNLSFDVFAATAGPSARQLYVFSDKTGYTAGNELLAASTTSGSPRIPYNTSSGQTFTIDLSENSAFEKITNSITFRLYIQTPDAGQSLALDDVVAKGIVSNDPAFAILLADYNMQTPGSRTVASSVDTRVSATDLAGNELKSLPGILETPPGNYYTTWSPDTGGGATVADAFAVNSYVAYTVTPVSGKVITLNSLSFDVFAATAGPSARQLYVFSDKTGYNTNGLLLTASTTSGAPLIPYNTSLGQTFTIDLSENNAFAEITDSVTFRFYIQTPDAGQSLAFDDIGLTGFVDEMAFTVGSISMVLDGTNFIINWSGKVGPTYGIEQTHDLVGGIWTNIQSLIGVDGSMSSTNSTSESTTFYRMIIE